MTDRMNAQFRGWGPAGLFCLVTAALCYMLFYAPAAAIYSIDDNLGFQYGSGIYFDNFITRGRLVSLLQIALEHYIHLDLMQAHQVLIFILIALIVISIWRFAQTLQIENSYLIFALCVVAMASPILIELTHFRIGILQYIIVFAGVIALQSALGWTSPRRRRIGIPLIIAAACTGYSAVFGIIFGLILIYSLLGFCKTTTPLRLLIENTALFFAGVFLYLAVWRILLAIYEKPSKFGRADSLQVIGENIAYFWGQAGELLFSISTANPFPLIFLLAVTLALPVLLTRWYEEVPGEEDAPRRSGMRTRLAAGLFGLVTAGLILTSYFNFHLSIFEGRLPPIRGYYALIYIGCLVYACAYRFGPRWLQLAVLGLITVQAGLYALTAAQINSSLNRLADRDKALAQDIARLVNSQDTPPLLYVYVDKRAARWTPYYENLVGGMNSHLLPKWSVYPYLVTTTGANFTHIEADSTIARQFRRRCHEKREETFNMSVEKSDGQLLICL